jgi:hypothetical protein
MFCRKKKKRKKEKKKKKNQTNARDICGHIAHQQSAKKLWRHHIMTLMEEIHPVYATG